MSRQSTPTLYKLSRYYQSKFPVYAGLRRQPGIIAKYELYAYAKVHYDEAHVRKWRYRIHIDDSVCEAGAVALLNHELAHVLTFFKDEHPSGHGEVFGRAYSRVWLVYEEWTERPKRSGKTRC